MKNFVISNAKKPLRFIKKSKSVDQTGDDKQQLSTDNRNREKCLDSSFDNFDTRSQDSQSNDTNKKGKLTEPSSGTVRKSFYENYTTQRIGTESNSTGNLVTQPVCITEGTTENDKRTKKTTKTKQTFVNNATDGTTPKPLSVKNIDKDRSKSSVTPFWLSSVREKRKLFIGKKSSSMDAGSTQSTIAQVSYFS